MFLYCRLCLSHAEKLIFSPPPLHIISEFLETEHEAAGFLQCCRRVPSFLGGKRTRIITQTLQIIKPELDQAALAASPSLPSALVKGESSCSPTPASENGTELSLVASSGLSLSPASSLIPDSFDY